MSCCMRKYCASRFSRWIPGLAPLAQERSLHSPGTREMRVPDERPRFNPSERRSGTQTLALDSRLRACEEIPLKTGTIENRSMYKPESDREPCSISSHALARE